MKALGIYAVHMVNKPSIMIPTRCWLLYLAIVPITPLNFPSMIRTFCPTLNLSMISVDATISSDSAEQIIIRLFI